MTDDELYEAILNEETVVNGKYTYSKTFYADEEDFHILRFVEDSTTHEIVVREVTESTFERNKREADGAA